MPWAQTDFHRCGCQEMPGLQRHRQTIHRSLCIGHGKARKLPRDRLDYPSIQTNCVHFGLPQIKFGSFKTLRPVLPEAIQEFRKFLPLRIHFKSLNKPIQYPFIGKHKRAKLAMHTGRIIILKYHIIL
jgi:hypothetical protein